MNLSGIFQRKDKSEISEIGLEARRSRVRIAVTYSATFFLFGGGILLMLIPFLPKVDHADLVNARELFTTISPIATGVITYWFASRSAEKKIRENNNNKDERVKEKKEQEDTVNVPD